MLTQLHGASSSSAAAEDEDAPRKERKGKTSAKKERIGKEDGEALNAAVAAKLAQDEE